VLVILLATSSSGDPATQPGVPMVIALERGP